MARTIRTAPDGSTTRDGHTTRSARRPTLRTRRQGTRAAILAAVVAEIAEDES